jgi:hypothetical protein
MQEKSASLLARKFVLMLLVLALVAFAANVQRVEAVGSLYTCTYYSDASHTTAVGTRGGACCGRNGNWGVTSPYSVCHELACTNVLCDPPLD